MKRNLNTAPAILLGLLLIASTAHAQGTNDDQINMLRELERAKNLEERRVARTDISSSVINGELGGPTVRLLRAWTQRRPEGKNWTRL
jgi:hypothetical protein